MESFWLAIIVSALPIIELRGGIPLAISSGIEAWQAMILCITANIAIIIPLWLFFDFLHEKLLSLKLYRHFSDRILLKIRRKSEKVKEKMATLGFIALMLFVAIPLPGTGVYTGGVIAWLLGLNRKLSFIALSAGAIIAGIIVTFLTLGVIGATRIV